MTMKQTDEQNYARKIVEKAIEKAWSDESFKQQLLSNSLMAIETLTGESFKFPEGRRIVFVEEEDTPESTDATVYINIMERNLDDLELTEEQLEAVAGGQSILPYIIPIDLPIICPPRPPFIGIPKM